MGGDDELQLAANSGQSCASPIPVVRIAIIISRLQMSIDRETALQMAQDEIARICGNSEPMTVLHTKVLEKNWGWFIPWKAVADLEAGYPPAPGIAPFLILRESGELRSTSTSNFNESVLGILGDIDGIALLNDLTRI
jgi:hypothetical protein